MTHSQVIAKQRATDAPSRDVRRSPPRVAVSNMQGLVRRRCNGVERVVMRCGAEGIWYYCCCIRTFTTMPYSATLCPCSHPCDLAPRAPYRPSTMADEAVYDFPLRIWPHHCRDQQGDRLCPSKVDNDIHSCITHHRPGFPPDTPTQEAVFQPARNAAIWDV